MFAVVETGGKQYRVAPGDVIKVEKLPAEPGTEVVLDKVLLVSTDQGVKVGSPHVEGAKVKAQVTRAGKNPKIFVFKYKAKKNYRRRFGHRQPFTELRIEAIEA